VDSGAEGTAPRSPWRRRAYQIIFEHDTFEGRAFDVVLLWLIVLSVLAVMLESVRSVRASYGDLLRGLEWFLTILFSLEYGLRLVSAPHAGRYARSLFGVVDLLAVVPTWLSVVIPGAQSLLVIRALRLLRVFRILKLGHHVGEAQILVQALSASRRKITVFVATILTVVVVIGAMMYLIEGEANGFTSIPTSIYWAIVTMTTVGYGDIAPQTVLGKVLASALMIVGYGVIAVPTGIVTSELTHLGRTAAGRACPSCGRIGHDTDAVHCKYCAAHLGARSA
jgi:voltage-gated potassium channel